jgi:hypothetical protein
MTRFESSLLPSFGLRKWERGKKETGSGGKRCQAVNEWPRGSPINTFSCQWTPLPS